jgi:hypothetical protein
MKNQIFQPLGKSSYFTTLPHLKLIAKIKGIKLNKVANYNKIILLYKIQQN